MREIDSSNTSIHPSVLCRSMYPSHYALHVHCFLTFCSRTSLSDAVASKTVRYSPINPEAQRDSEAVQVLEDVGFARVKLPL